MAMLKNKDITFSLILMCLIVVAPMAKAQIIGDLLAGILRGFTSVANVQGMVMCTANGTISTNNVTSIPPFPNAGVVLQCLGINVSSTTTNGAGVFSFTTSPLLNFLSALLTGGCRVVVTTPLAICNAGLPSNGTLSAPVRLLEATSTGIGSLNIFNFVPAGPFRLG